MPRLCDDLLRNRSWHGVLPPCDIIPHCLLFVDYQLKEDEVGTHQGLKNHFYNTIGHRSISSFFVRFGLAMSGFSLPTISSQTESCLKVNAAWIGREVLGDFIF